MLSLQVSLLEIRNMRIFKLLNESVISHYYPDPVSASPYIHNISTILNWIRGQNCRFLFLFM
jgi:hypothetical protein